MAEKEKGPQWYMRLIKRMMDKGLTKKEAHRELAGAGKHRRQRKRAIGYWVRKRKIERERRKLRNAVRKRVKANTKRRAKRQRKKGHQK